MARAHQSVDKFSFSPAALLIHNTTIIMNI